MSWEEEKKIYAKKLEKLVKGIEEIREIEGNRLITADMAKDLEKSIRTAEKLLPKLSGDVFEIAVVGLEKAGKSSFSNALTGLAVLPTDDQRCTYTSTCIRPGEVNRGVVKFYNQREFERSFSEKLKELQIPDAEKYNLRNLTLSRYEQLYENCPPFIKKQYDDNLNLDIRDTLEHWGELQKYIGHADMEFTGKELEGDEFAQFIKNPARAIAVKDVILYSTELKEMPNAVLYDVPGFDSPTAMHRAQTLQKMSDADAIIMVASAKQPSITSPALSIFRENVDDYGCKLDEKLFIFANKADAVTSAEQLLKNIDILKNEWIIKRKILSPGLDGRITWGSANAHLGEKVDKGLECRETLESYGQSDGVGEQRDKLVEYYRGERFDVLKKRVMALMKEVQDVFSVVDCDISGDSALDHTMISKLVSNSNREITRFLEDELARIRAGLQAQQPLKKAIIEKIEEIISLDKYQLTDEQIEETKRRLYTTGQAPMPTAVNTKMRESRFFDMQQSFTQQVIGCAVSRHDEVAAQILDAFMTAMNVGKGREEYEGLKADTAKYCGLDKAEDEFYYRSLIERFARDLFEVQILTAHGTDRKAKFMREAANFLSLGVFYSRGNEGEDENFLPQDPFSSRLWRLILYPEIARKGGTENSVNKEDIFNLVKKLTNLRVLDSALESMVALIIKNRGNLAAAAIEAALQTLRKGMPDRAMTQKVKELLHPLTVTKGGDADLEEILTTSRYLDDRHQRELNYDYEQVKSDFSDDVLALRDVLLNAFVPAVNLDKAFIAKESTYIEKIIEELKEEKFSDFISEHLGIIKRDELEQINGDRAQKELDRVVMRQIRGILSTLSVVPMDD